MRECVVFLSCRVTPHDIFMFGRLKESAGDDRDVLWYCNAKPCDTHGETVRFFQASEVKDLGVALYSDRDDGFTTYKLRGSEYGVLYLCRKDHVDVHYDAFWYCENDVYLDGDWKEFMDTGRGLDLYTFHGSIGTNEYQAPGRVWGLYRYGYEWLGGFTVRRHGLLCLMRMSARLMDAVLDFCGRMPSDKAPYMEELIPTIAYGYHGFTVGEYYSPHFAYRAYTWDDRRDGTAYPGLYHPVKDIFRFLKRRG